MKTVYILTARDLVKVVNHNFWKLNRQVKAVKLNQVMGFGLMLGLFAAMDARVTKLERDAEGAKEM